MAVLDEVVFNFDLITVQRFLYRINDFSRAVLLWTYGKLSGFLFHNWALNTASHLVFLSVLRPNSLAPLTKQLGLYIENARTVRKMLLAVIWRMPLQMIDFNSVLHLLYLTVVFLNIYHNYIWTDIHGFDPNKFKKTRQST